ncbi:hypothetical protein S245_023096, partial [Arachis hypogaea]
CSCTELVSIVFCLPWMGRFENFTKITFLFYLYFINIFFRKLNTLAEFSSAVPSISKDQLCLLFCMPIRTANLGAAFDY